MSDTSTPRYVRQKSRICPINPDTCMSDQKVRYARQVQMCPTKRPVLSDKSQQLRKSAFPESTKLYTFCRWQQGSPYFVFRFSVEYTEYSALYAIACPSVCWSVGHNVDVSDISFYFVGQICLCRTHWAVTDLMHFHLTVQRFRRASSCSSLGWPAGWPHLYLGEGQEFWKS